ncbi:unnamed protein product [Rhizophagus irregularis]|nr:unnamed protein product [Rhizophagus irregularis]
MSILERCSICTSNRIKIWLEPIQMALLENYASNLSKGASNNASNLPRAHSLDVWNGIITFTSVTVMKKYTLLKKIYRVEYSIEAEEPSIEWEFSTPNWLDKIAQEHQLLTSTICETKYNEFYQLNLDKHIEKNIMERIRLLDSTIFSERNYSEFLRATRQKRIGEEVSSSDEKRIRREEPELLDGNQFRIIGEIMRNDLPQQQNSERDIDMFIKRHIFSCFDTILDSHFGEVVSRLQGIIEHQVIQKDIILTECHET